MHIKTGDTVVVISGARQKDKNAKGKILKVFPKTDRVIVEGVNIRKKALKPQGSNTQSGIIDQEGSIHASNVLLWCEKCGKGVRTGNKILNDGKKVRYCKHCGETFE
ncbi:MAG: 50S ribosomal protein L24 [Eubacteriaceae bacterium]|jgi:large subunit ribosomal protein L24|nr:50S ribosomal protein L24 [Eubacteriaceae bacterium]